MEPENNSTLSQFCAMITGRSCASKAETSTAKAAIADDGRMKLKAIRHPEQQHLKKSMSAAAAPAWIEHSAGKRKAGIRFQRVERLNNTKRKGEGK